MTQDEMPLPGTSYSQEQPNPEIEILSKNHAEDLSEDELTAIGEKCRRGFETDLDSRGDWEQALDDWLKLAKQHREPKSFPWPSASNVKYPLLTTAAMQFAARAYPSLVPSNGKLVKSQVIGKDPTGEKYTKGERVSDYMSYQFMHDMDDWEEDMDKMLMMLPVVGCVFKKTWYDKSEDKIRSKFILPKNFVVNYWTKSLESTERTSELFDISPRVLQEKQNLGIYLDVDLGVPMPFDSENDGYTSDDETLPYTLVEQHTFLDLDKDGYREPYRESPVHLSETYP
jgi:chaperonin GroES